MGDVHNCAKNADLTAVGVTSTGGELSSLRAAAGAQEAFSSRGGESSEEATGPGDCVCSPQQAPRGKSFAHRIEKWLRSMHDCDRAFIIVAECGRQ